MLQIQKISKQYTTGDLVQIALYNVSLNLRDSEFVAILGPSGSGKTTLLNIIGGLDRYDSGDLVINDISTKKYKDRDWDSYRNHTIGFVFQSYNLIPHQSILSNVELALTISGISKSERKRRAKEALENVGLGDQLHKKPNQMSGGQMQRVAIARALINNPDILLADEPTGALDTETSIQVMNLLKEVAKDRLVVMVTHNPEIAEEYSNRIVKLRDGKIIDDTNPFEVDSKSKVAEHKNMGKSSMSFLTSLSLSFNNLRTKKGRTFLTAFAGSIGIIGIALILSLSNGVNNYIEDIQKETMTSYPITVEATAVDLSSMVQAGGQDPTSTDSNHALDKVYANSMDIEMASAMTSMITENNLTEFKKYLDNPDSEIHEHVGENGIVYAYSSKFGIYTTDPNGKFTNTNGSTLESQVNKNAAMMAEMSGMGDMTAQMMNSAEEILPGKDGELISSAVIDSYDVIYGSWPTAYDEIVLRVSQNNEISATTLYSIGMLPADDYKEHMDKIMNGEKIEFEDRSWTYEDLCSKEYYMIPDCDTYIKNEDGTYTSIKSDSIEMEKLFDNAVKLKITGIIRAVDDAQNANIMRQIAYTKALSDYIIDYSNNSEIVKAQLDSKDINVLNGMKFSPSDDKAKIDDAISYLNGLGVSEKAKLFTSMMQMSAAYSGGAAAPAPDSPAAAQMPDYSTMSETELAGMMDMYLLAEPDDQTMLMIYDAYISTGTYEDNMTAFGLISLDAPSSIRIYSDSFESKDLISDCIENYNKTVSEEHKITYTDYVGLLMSSITTIINVISYVLIAFVAVSLIVSSIMIGIITYISVLERTKEIGILRAIGASKHNISQVFNAETFIIGLCSGLIGIGVTLLILIPANMVIHHLTGSMNINAELPLIGGVVLILLSMFLTLLGGFIPAKTAAKKDPVTALRSE